MIKSTAMVKFKLGGVNIPVKQKPKKKYKFKLGGVDVAEPMKKSKRLFINKEGVPDRKFARARRKAQPIVVPGPDKKDRKAACKRKLGLLCNSTSGHRNKIRVELGRPKHENKKHKGEYYACRKLLGKGSDGYVACGAKKKNGGVRGLVQKTRPYK